MFAPWTADLMGSADDDLCGTSAKVQECKMPACVSCGADTKGDGGVFFAGTGRRGMRLLRKI